MTRAGMESLGDVTLWLRGLREGNAHADSSLVESLALDLRRLAAARLRRERSVHTLTPTALVNEAWIRLAGQKEQWQSRSHFFAIAAQAMRRILVDHARRSHATKREVEKEELFEDQIILDTGLAAEDLIALDNALRQLADLSPRQARVVELRFFAGLTEDETAAVLDVNRRTVNRDWEMARTWLFGQLRGKDRV